MEREFESAIVGDGKTERNRGKRKEREKERAREKRHEQGR